MVNEITVSSGQVPTAFSGFRIAQISDLHNAEFGEGNEKLLQTVNGCDPDIIVIAGDLVDANHTDIDIALAFADEAVKIAPTYYVTGNHEAVSLEQPGESITLIAPNQGLFPKYDAGLCTGGNTNMVVSRGIGNSIIPIRFNNRPEIVVVTLISL